MRRLSLIFILLAFCANTFAQTFDLDKNRFPLISIDGLWRFHAGDDMRWADPNFDDSSWTLLRTDKPWTEQGFPELKGFVWYRFRVALSAGERPTALMLPYIKDDYEVYVNGRKVRPALSGTLPGSSWSALPEAVPLEPGFSGHTQAATVAIRVWLQVANRAAIDLPLPSFSVAPTVGLVGSGELIEERVRAANASAVAQDEDRLINVVVKSLIGALVLGLFCLRTKDREYLWFAIMLLASAACGWLAALGFSFGRVSVVQGDFLSDVFWDIQWAGALLFIQTVLHRARSLVWWICFTAALTSTMLRAILLGVPPASNASYAVGNILQVILALPASCWILMVLTRQAALRDRDAQLLLVPALLRFGWEAIFMSAYPLQGLRWIPDHVALAIMNASVNMGPWRMGLGSLTHVIFAASLLAFLIRRFALSRQREERLVADIEAARQVQQILLPEENPAVKGFEIETIYLPAETVSGDFFQHIPDEQGGLLIVAGDVAGKGLQAAMLVSVLVGAIRTEASHTSDASRILSVLNERLQGQGKNSFATCLVAHISCDGEMRIANAGHIPPYLNGASMELPGSLPLGMAADSEYEVHEFQLVSGDALRFVSDGVLEAQDAAGNLLGFERTRELSREKAQQIAKAAQEFGQKDDITVVAVDFLGVAHAAA